MGTDLYNIYVYMRGEANILEHVRMRRIYKREGISTQTTSSSRFIE